MSRASIAIGTLAGMAGSEIGCSQWMAIDQLMVDRFADLTDDHQYIHVDPVRARETPFGGTIAHGFLTLSLLSAMAESALPDIEGRQTGLNYGFESVRFLSPVRVGSRVRGRFVLASCEERKPGQWQLCFAVTVEIEGEEKPAIVARWLSLALF